MGMQTKITKLEGLRVEMERFKRELNQVRRMHVEGEKTHFNMNLV